MLKVALNTITLTLKFYLKVRRPNNSNKKKRRKKKKKKKETYPCHGFTFRLDKFYVSFESLDIIITSITNPPPGLTVILVIISVSTFETVVILYVYSIYKSEFGTMCVHTLSLLFGCRNWLGEFD